MSTASTDHAAVAGHKSRRIAYLIPEFPGQTHIFLWRERRALEEMGISVDLISTRMPNRAIAPHSWTEEAQRQTVYLLPVNASELLKSAWEILRAGPAGWFRVGAAIATAEGVSFSHRARMLAQTALSAKLIWLSRQQRWDHLHVHSCAESAHIAMLAWLLGRLPYSLTLHGPTLEGYGPNQRQKWQHARFATVISNKLLDVVKTRLRGAVPAQVGVAPMGVDLDVIQRLTPYQPWQAGSPFRIFSCGRLNPVKGHNFLIDAVAALRARNYDIRLDIAGEDEFGGRGYRQDLEQQIVRLGLQDAVRLLGAVPESRIQDGLDQAHAFVIASLNEGISVAIMEAMAMGLPVIATDVGGNSELIDNGENAIMVTSGSAEPLVAAILQVAENPLYAASLAKASRSKVEQSFHHRVSANLLAQYLLPASSVAADKPAASPERQQRQLGDAQR